MCELMIDTQHPIFFVGQKNKKIPFGKIDDEQTTTNFVFAINQSMLYDIMNILR
jgi:hypothetical protein